MPLKKDKNEKTQLTHPPPHHKPLKFKAKSLKEFCDDNPRLKAFYNTQSDDYDEKFENFKEILKDFKAELKANLARKETEPNVVSNVLKPFFTKLGFKAENKSLKGQISIDLCLFKKDKTSVLIEAKLPTNDEFPQLDDFSKKGLHQAILYYLWERKVELNLNISYIIITDFKRFYIIDIQEFCARFYHEEIKNAFDKFYDKEQRLFNSTDYFYDEIYNILKNEKYSHKYLTQKSENLFDDKGNAFDLSPSINGIYLDLTLFIDKDKDDEKLFEDAFKILSKDFLNNEFSIKDANEINEPFYKELLYILGLEEKTEKGKNLIKHNNVKNSVYDLVKRHLSDKNQLSNEEEKDNEVIMGFIIVWLNRILFIKLIEGNLIKFNDKSAAFFNKEFIKDFSDLNSLFFEVFAKNFTERSESKFPALPYLNSSLFDKTDFEKNLMEISNLDSFKPKICTYHKGEKFELFSYLIDFLNSYNFSSQGETKKLINPSILGKIFEKLNGYKDGSIFTPAEITMYMCRASLEKVVLGKFNDKFKWQCENLDDLRLQIDRNFTQTNRADFLSILKDIKICDPAVGSGHFLVSALNEMIKIYHTLGLLDFRCENIDIINDELVINNGKYAYKRNDANTFEIQKGLFHLKQTIIENNLFGVDINPKSVEICKLRLWIELLKNGYYLLKDDEKFNPNLSKEFHQMQTLPNIDINIKCGNSLISRFTLKDNFADKDIKKQVKDYKALVFDYKNANKANFKISKNELETKIKALKQGFALSLADFKTKNALEKALDTHFGYYGNFLLDDKRLFSGLALQSRLAYDDINLDEKTQEKAVASFTKIKFLRTKLDTTLSGESYKNAFEWRFEFPEVLKENGEFMGFDLVVGNPPYVVKKKKDYPQYQWNGDLYTMFFELGFKLAKQNGYLNFITPRFWLVNASCEKMRKYFLNSVNLLSLVETNPFEQAKTENVITEIQICNKQQNFVKHSKEVNKVFSFVDNIDKKDFLVNSKCEIIFNVDKNLLALFDKICKDTILLKSIIQTKRGAEYGKKFIKEFNSGMKILLGEDMRAYNIEWNDTFVDISLKDIQRLLEFFNTKNLIYLRRVDKRLSASMSNEMFAFTKNIYGIQITNKKYNPKFILGLLNSKLLNFYYLKKFTTKKEDIFPEIQTYLYEQLPLPQINSTNQSLVDEIINLVDKILALKAKNSSADTSQLECDIDDLVFKLYDLNEADISKIKF